MERPALTTFLRDTRPPLVAGVLGGAFAVAITTALIFPLRTIVPAVSTGVVYLLAVLIVATWSGLWVGIGTAVASALAFNWFHIPPTGRFTISDPQNWVALVVFLVTAAIASSIAELARVRAREAVLRRREADLAAELARLLLGGTDVRSALPLAAQRLEEALDLPGVTIELGDNDAHTESADPAGPLAVPLLSGANRRIATLRFETPPHPTVRDRLTHRVVPALEAILGVALDREALQQDAVEARALRRSDELKTSLLRAVSHDLRSPLTAIATAGEALASPSLTDAERDELASAVNGEAQRLSRLVDKLLDLSRLQGGAADPRPEWSSVEEVLRVAIAETPHAAGFNVGIDPDLPLVRADAAQLERAFANLLENAVRYSGDNPVAVRARVVGHRMLIRIVDRGPGIPGRELERIFEAFHRGPRARGIESHVGSGLGLAVVRGFVEANGGRVWAESLPGQGATFVVELPLDREQLRDAGEQPRAGEQRPSATAAAARARSDAAGEPAAASRRVNR